MSAIRDKIRTAVYDALKGSFPLADIDDDTVMLETPRDASMGDYATNAAMRLARKLHAKPSDIAAQIVETLNVTLRNFAEVSLAGPGFINFRLTPLALTETINPVIEAGDDYGKNDTGHHERILLEYVSANPTGSLHCGHARGAAWGDAVARLLKASGYDVLREYYINDAGHQIDMLAESLYSRYCACFDVDYPLPEDGYHGDDVKALGQAIASREGDKWLAKDAKEWFPYFKERGIADEMAKIKADLKEFRVEFDSWIHERFFYENNEARINDVLERMAKMGLTYEAEGALWFAASRYGDDKDRVLRKNTGLLTYLTPDIANHVYKLERGYGKLVDFWGADHHGYVKRMQCALEALGYPADCLEVDLIQMVRMIEDGQEVKMSKRTGNAITLRELCEDVGVDAARYFFVSKEAGTHMDFDMNLAREKSNDNPVYYAQYAYTRMFSIMQKAGDAFKRQDEYRLLIDEKEQAMLKMVSEFTDTVAQAARQRAPHKICAYCQSLARLFHSYYNSCRVYDPANPELSNERLGLVKAVMTTMKNALDLIGLAAPEKM